MIEWIFVSVVVALMLISSVLVRWGLARLGVRRFPFGIAYLLAILVTIVLGFFVFQAWPWIMSLAGELGRIMHGTYLAALSAF